jgi:hypothetical protein
MSNQRFSDHLGLSPFGRLAKGQALGKSSILIYDNKSNDVQSAPVDMITIAGDDLDACQLAVTLHPPRVIPLSFGEARERLDRQNLTGEQTNSEVTAGDFPGTDKPMRWPPLEALIEFGTGGVSTQVVVDYVNGVTLSVIASYLRVHALITQSRKDGEIFGTSAAYYLAAHVGPGFVENHVQRTVFVADVRNREESDVFDVPKFAKRASVVGCGHARHHDHEHTHHEHHHDDLHEPHELHGHRHAPLMVAGWIRFWQSPDGTNCVGDFFISGAQPVAIDVPNGGQYFTVFNEAGHKMELAVIFELAL